MRRSLAGPTLGLLLLGLSAGPAAATSFDLSAMLDGAQETPPVTTDGTGTLSGTYDDVSNLLTWSGSFSDLNDVTSDAHFHGPADVGEGPAGIQVPMTGGMNVFPLDVLAGSFSGMATISDTQEAQLLAGLWYVNIHTDAHLGGEIRGQVFAVATPEPGTLGLLAAALAGIALARRRAAR
jgi:hypothetical protein